MVRPSSRIRRLVKYAAGMIVFSLLPIALSGQDPDGWISVLEPSEWSGEVTRGLAVVPRNSIRVGGSAFQPGGVNRILIIGRRAQLDPQSNGEVRFVGYADTDSLSGRVEVVAYASEPRPPVIREYRYDTNAESRFDQPEEAFDRRGFQGERYAVVIGISNYADPAITPLRYADDDAQAFYDFLISESAGLGGFKPENIRLLLNDEADSRSVRTALPTFLRLVTE